ncbi:RagB/SusD family nutrient uptake outer membrane protein [uncultured Bacteroides sp.]|uniref:RagB/SusD family nutrient uptake outer membrane protein n=1 Tax=uncultured Bacteroides sp. TaxID=162156 RepID=UPI0026744BDE|nr:RagB/SusD family nutrient uptake outer membrane protein [uncultured Bacteroides sp.]
MKIFAKSILALCLAVPTLTGCLEETFPASSTATSDQVGMSDLALGALNNSIISSMTKWGSDNTAFGYAGLMMWRDVMLQDMPVYETAYDYFNYGMGTTTFLGDYTIQYDFWNFYYSLIHQCNLLIEAVNVENLSSTGKHYLGNAYAFRAMAYMDCMRLYEFKHTGTELDAKAEARGIMKITVPIVTENTTEEEGRKNPRAPFYQMYRFVYNDLERASEYLADYTRGDSKNYVDITVINGMKARFWMELGSRFELYPEDLQTQVSYENDESLAQYAKLGISTAKECYANAQSCARKAIDEGGYSPVTESQWFETTTGFNSVNQAWMFAIMMGANDPTSTWKCYVGQMSPEQQYGTTQYGAWRMIGASLYNKIADADWRKTTWIDPEDAGKTSVPAKYKTLLSGEEWAKRPAYTGFKIRPNEGNMTEYLTGTVVDIPLMRMEEMLFIEAEAAAHTEGVSSAVSKLENFMNTYRYKDGSYRCNATDLDGFIDELLVQKRIEFWGEGILLWDYKRLEKAVIRGYSGTNLPETHRFNSYEGYVAPWMTVYITSSEYQYNTILEETNNPDPSGVIPQWDGQ